ncbi:hypothetical protein [Mongoliimonas terrestris]|uniref:hypothetical protein n=1 Tax=Mongoliimonas terrestris TaxID=1709001 RepID=UPI000AA125F0|nr:hypothetical protein [Mongoliimonas terrestris]
MPILLFILIVILIAQIGFWDTLGALFGAVGALILFVLIVAAIIGVGVNMAVRRARRRL